MPRLVKRCWLPFQLQLQHQSQQQKQQQVQPRKTGVQRCVRLFRCGSRTKWEGSSVLEPCDEAEMTPKIFSCTPQGGIMCCHSASQLLVTDHYCLFHKLQCSVPRPVPRR
mmetsp:Transcript_46980/g.73527  ORF Transcript_46980/g.73527 Transcript_46980/m.73527 type:complete len:110 (+) Transcript_46980:1098-1427(+)